MPSERQNFDLSRLRHFGNIDWHDSNHRRCVAASLVQGVCIQERGRQARRFGQDALADGGSIFGAVYKWSRKAARSVG